MSGGQTCDCVAVGPHSLWISGLLILPVPKGSEAPQSHSHSQILPGRKLLFTDYSRPLVLNQVKFCPLPYTLGIFGNVQRHSVMTIRGAALGIEWIEDKNAAQHRKKCTGQLPVTINCLAPNVNSAEVEKPCPGRQHSAGVMAKPRWGGSRRGQNINNEDNLQGSSRTLPDLCQGFQHRRVK